MLSTRLATVADAAAICDLANAAYRGTTGERGWTSEADLVAGNRTDVRAVEEAITRPRSAILLALESAQIVACVQVAQEGTDGHIGLLAVSPVQQGHGTGSWLLARAEDYVWRMFGAQRAVLAVIHQRPALRAFYERRGYRRVGASSPYPIGLKVGVPKLELTVDRLVKPRPEAGLAAE